MRGRVAAVALLACVAGCGGSSSDANDSTPTPTPTPTAEPTATTGTAFESGDVSSSTSSRLTAGRPYVLRRPLPVGGAPVRVRTVDVPLPDSVRVRPVRRAPGDGVTQSFSDRGDWPPRGTDGVLAGATVQGDRTDAVVGFTPTQPGVVVLGGLDVAYERDGQRFRQVTPGFDCYVVGPGPSTCDVADDFPDDRVVGLGVSFPPDRGTRLRRAEDQGLGVEVVLDGRPGRGELTIPLVNRSDRTARIEDFTRQRSVVEGGQTLLVAVRDAEPFELAPGESRDVTLAYRVAGCFDGQPLGSTGSFPATDATTGEAIPLGVWFAVGRGPRC